MTRVKQPKQLPKQGLSSTKPRGRALFLCRDGSQVSHKGIERLYEFQRIRCTICLTSPENHQKKEDHTWKACACLQHLSWSCFTSKAGAAVVKNGVSGCSARHPTRRNEGSKGSQRTAGAAGHHKMVDKRKAICCALLRWIRPHRFGGEGVLIGGKQLHCYTKCSITFVNIAVAISALAGGGKNGFAPRPELGGVFDIFRGFLGVWAQEGIEMEFWVILVAFRQWKNGQTWTKTLYITRFCKVFGCQSIENTAKTSVLDWRVNYRMLDWKHYKNTVKSNVLEGFTAFMAKNV